jgi:cytochrome oxidase Cu insertion factor (SCO1/SenC/PrrC family)
VVWVFGESFGGIFAPGLTWLFGAPGAVLIYCVAGALIALPERAWHAPRLGRLLLAGTGLFLIGMAVLQAWPGRGFWQGMSHGQPGTLTGMIQNMAQTSQPHFLSALVADFGSFTAAHGFAVNLVAVTALAVIGAGFMTGRPRLVQAAVIAGIVLCLADWVLIEDLGFLGGLGTDPNSMIPMILVFTAGYLALVRVPAPAAAGQPTAVTQSATADQPEPGPAGPAGPGRPGWRDRVRLAGLREAAALASGRSVAVVGAVALIVLGAAPMALASADRNADPILAQAIDGSSAPVDYPAPAFSLTDQHGATVSLASLRGKAVLLTFLDPVCVSDCPLIAQEFRQAGQQLGAAARHVELVAIVVNPLFYTVAYTQAFDRQENLASVPDWLYLTSSPARLAGIWRAYGITGEISPAGAMIAHNDIVFVIDRAGRVRKILDFDPGPGTAPTQASFATQLSDAAQQMLGSS